MRSFQGILFTFFLAAFASASASADLGYLSPEEEQYLRDNPEINFVSQTSYPPFEFIDDAGERQGMTIELVRWMSTEFGFQASFTDMTFQEAQDAVLSGEADVITSFFYSQARDQTFDFTESMFEIPARIFVNLSTTDINSITDLAGKTVAVQRGDYAIDFLRAEGIQCSFVYADDFSDATHLLVDGKAVALVGDEQIVKFHLYNCSHLGDISAVGDTLYVGLNCMAVAQGDSLLCSILTKGIDHALTIGIIDGIATKWQSSPITVSEKHRFPYKAQLLIAFGAILIAGIIVFFWNLRLRHVVERRTLSLKESEKRLDQALNQANLGSWDCDIATGEVINNERYSVMFGYSPGEIDFSYDGWLSLIHPDDRKDIESHIKKFLEEDTGRFEHEYRMKTKEGEWISVHSCGGVVERSHSGKPVRIAGIHQDITRRKHSEHLARKAVDDWENTFNALSELIAVLDADGVIIRVNKAQAHIFGMTPEECIGLKLYALMHPDNPSGEICIPEISSGEFHLPEQHEVFLKKFGCFLEVSMSVSKDIEDGSVRIVHVARNITERKRAEQKQREMEGRVQHAQKLESLGVLAGGIAHDFNNILMAIRGYTDLAVSLTNEGDPVCEYLEKINRSVGTASELSGQMLAYSGKGNFVVETVYLNDIIEKMKPMFHMSVSRKADLVFHLKENMPCITVDSTQMEQVILNLVTNASEAIGSSRGTITVTTGVKSTFAPGNAESEGTKLPYVFLQVNDTGSGMSDDVCRKLFEPFFTTKFTGRGLGMAVVQGIVEGHKGFIQVSSKEGVGSTLKIFIPAVDEVGNNEVSSSDSVDSASTQAPAGVLLVDDEKNILFVGQLALKKSGYTVFTADHGENAIKIYKEKQDEIQCVVLDLTMPVMDGVECLRELKILDPDIRVILSSGYNQQDVESRINSDEIAGYLKKPYGLNALRAVVGKVLKG